jgi:hypothetical protein
LRKLVVLTAVTVAMLATAASAQAFIVSLQAPTHTPQAGKPWPIKVGAHKHKGGKRIHASAYYQFLFNGNIVQSCKPLPSKPGGQKCNDGTHAKAYRFFGIFRDVVVWPARSIGFPLTFRVVVHARGGGTKHVDYNVQVHG